MKASSQIGKKFRRNIRGREVRQEILRLCRDKFMTKKELASRLRLSVNTVRAHYLYPMIRAGQLELLIPDRPRSQSQAYKAKF